MQRWRIGFETAYFSKQLISNIYVNNLLSKSLLHKNTKIKYFNQVKLIFQIRKTQIKEYKEYIQIKEYKKA